MLYNLKLVEVVDLIYNCEVLCFNLGYNANYPVQDFVCVCACVRACARVPVCSSVLNPSKCILINCVSDSVTTSFYTFSNSVFIYCLVI
jgi:hypothetical protein